jgi:hypothetical protein
VWTGATVDLSGDAGGVFDEEFTEVLKGVPTSAFVAEGSPVTVYRPRHLAASSATSSGA